MYYKVKRLNPELPDLDIDLQPCKREPMTAQQKAAYDAHLRTQLTELRTNYARSTICGSTANPLRSPQPRSVSCRPSILINDRAFGASNVNTHAAEREPPARVRRKTGRRMAGCGHAAAGRL